MIQTIHSGEAIRNAIATFQKEHAGIRHLCVSILVKTAFGVSFQIKARVKIEKFVDDPWSDQEGVEILLPREWKTYRFTKERPVKMEDITGVTYRRQVVYEKPE